MSVAVIVQRSTAMVKWSTVGQANIYRVGHKGKVMQSSVCMYVPLHLAPSPLYTVACLCIVVLTFLIDFIMPMYYSLLTHVGGSSLHCCWKWWIL